MSYRRTNNLLTAAGRLMSDAISFKHLLQEHKESNPGTEDYHDDLISNQDWSIVWLEKVIARLNKGK